ncbi:hypothetical protein [Actinoallomurus iriomotensis]|uniref:Uncharacterized protein n=1 Tax=Actinoallomurus iriomotensis TaxID=478107 RepID=A0A9W6VU68_9ACTN|nr:hypothetical protein [Actinoallomurus iriomotensis]GLY80450.1 hypothetical protein Airi01_087170 [Actinoallomurus iriomotensis]
MFNVMVPWASDILLSAPHHARVATHVPFTEAAHHILADGNIPDPGSPETPPGSTKILTGLRWMKWVGYLTCVGAFIGLGVNMAIHHRRSEGGRHLTGMGWVFLGVIFIGSSTAFVSTIAGLK